MNKTEVKTNGLLSELSFDDVYRQFELKELMGGQNESIPQTQTQTNLQQNLSPEIIYNSFPEINDGLRKNIALGIEIYKTIKNFDYEYVHNSLPNLK